MTRVILRLLVLVLCLRASGEETPPTRSWRLTQINAKIADLQRQLNYWQEKRRELLGIPDAAPDPEAKDKPPVHTGPRNGKYHYSPSGKKVYERVDEKR